MNHRGGAALSAALALLGTLDVSAGAIDGGRNHTCALDPQGLAWCWGSDASGQQGNEILDDTTSSPQRAGPAIVFADIAAGGSHVCGRTPASAVWCWGENGENQIGDGTSTDKTEPVLVSGLEAKSISAGSSATCGIRVNGKVACWGNFMISAPGTPDNAAVPSDISIPSLFSFAHVSVGLIHACAINAAGKAWCWGHNPEGQLGIGSTGETNALPTPVQQPVGIQFESIVAGGTHTCAIDSMGDGWCWGNGALGQLGNGEADSPIPLKLVFPEPVQVTQLALGETFTCALDAAGRIWCWGSNYSGQAALGTSRVPVTEPRLVEFPPELRFESIGAGDNSACAITTLGETWCWGDGMQGEHGLGYFGHSSLPVPIGDAAGYSGLTSGAYHACMIDAENRVWCWGNNSYGQLARGDTTDSASIFPIIGSSLPENATFAQVSAGELHTCGVLQTGQGACWGSNADGRLGNGAIDVSPQTLPTLVALDQNVQLAHVSAGGGHTCALDTQGQLWCWGRDGHGQLGNGPDGADQPVPVALSVPGKSFRSLTTGRNHTCAIDDPIGSVYCWGDNSSGQLGFGDTLSRDVPTAWSGLTNFGFSRIVAGDNHTCALRLVPGDNTLSQVWCWGENGQGQIGDGTTVDRLTLVAVGFAAGSGDSTNAAHLALGAGHTCVRRPGGDTECWGDNALGQLADGSFADRPSPSPSGFAGAFELAAGTEHTCMLDAAGQLACAGSRRYGQLGDGKMGYVAPPLPIPAFVAFTSTLFQDGFEQP